MVEQNRDVPRIEDYTLGSCIEDLLPRKDRKIPAEYEKPNTLLLLESIKLYNDLRTLTKTK